MNEEIAGKYFGTEINGKWWRRYTKDRLLARGNGTFSFNKHSILFLRLLTKNPIDIKFEEIVDIKIGKWHAGQWGAGQQIVKVIWEKKGQILSSGFSFSKEPDEVQTIVSKLNRTIEAIKNKTIHKDRE